MNKNLNLFNTLTNKKEKFVPLNKENVGMYVCGPTVYDFPHIGNARPLVVFDVLFRTMVCAQVMGNDQTVGIAGQSGNFELNVMMPIAAHNLLESIEILSKGSDNFSKQCIEGLVATEKGPNMVNQGLAICTALAPKSGYDKVANIAHIASETRETIKQVTLKETELTSEEIDEILEPLSMTEPK